MKSAQVQSQVFVYMLGAVLIVLILLLGYSGVSTLTSRSQDAQLDSFQARILADIETTAAKTGSVRTATYSLPAAITEICFHGATQSGSTGGCQQSQAMYSQLIADALTADDSDGMFILGDRRIERINTVVALDVSGCSVQCFPAAGSVSLRLEGKGSSVAITPSPS